MATVEDVLVVARDQLGVAEDPPGSNRVPFAAWAGIQGQPWCAAFACWVLDQADALDVARYVYTPTGVSLYRQDERFGREPRLGAVVFFQWPGMGRVAHVGLVEAVRADGSIVSIEGNTDAKGGRTGGKVMRQVRRANIAGYGYPDYSAIQPPEVMRVQPEWDPPLPGFVSFLANRNGPGGWGLGLDGGLFAVGGAPWEWDDGGPGGSAAGQDYFRGRVAARLKAAPDGRPIILATSEESYGPDFRRKL